MRLVVVLLAACGASGGTDGGAAKGDGGATAEVPTEPAEAAEPISIERLDKHRYIVEADAMIQLGIEHNAGLVSFVRSGKVYAISEIADASTAARLGLLKGDVIRGVNNVEMTSGDRLQRAWNRARREQQVKLMLERDGAVIELQWIFARGVEGRISSFRPSLGDRDRSTPEYVAIISLARASLVETGLHRYKIDRAVLAALREHPRLGDRRVANIWTARGSQRGVTIGVNSIYSAFGLGRFDIIKGVGAGDVRTSSNLQQLIAAQAEAPELTIVAVKLDEPVVLRYQIVEGTIDAGKWTAALDAWKKRDAESGDDGYGSLGSGPYSSRLQPPPDISGIKRISDLLYEIKPMHLEVFSFNSVRRDVRIVPSIKNGKPNGFKLYAIRSSSPLSHLGFRNGDTLHSINGVVLKDLVALMQISKALEKVKSFDVELTRRGKPATIRYKVKR